MDRRRENQRRTGRRLPTVLALLALLTQLMIPVAARAAESAAADRMQTAVICTADGAVEMAVPDPAQHHDGFAGLQCSSCVMTSVAAIAPGQPLVVPVRYAARIDRVPAGEDRPQARSRAPPRPPSTAPPVFPNA